MTEVQQPTAAANFETVIASSPKEDIARFIEAHLWELFNTSYDLLVAQVSSLPADILANYPTVQLLHPMVPVSARSNNPVDTAKLMSTAISRCLDPHFSAVLRIVGLRLNGDITLAHRHALQLKETLRRSSLSLQPAKGSPLWFFHHQISAIMFMAGHSTQALAELALARQIGRASGSPDAQYSTGVRESMLHALRGSLDESASRLDDLVSTRDITPAYVDAGRSTTACALAMLSLQRVDAHLDRRLRDIGRLDSLEVMWPAILLLRTRDALRRQQPAQALEAVSISMSAHHLDPQSLAYDVALSARVESYLLLNEVQQARQLLGAESSPGVYSRVAEVRLALYTSDFALVRKLIGTLQKDHDLTPYHRTELMLLAAWSEYLQLQKISAPTAEALLLHCGPEHRLLLSFLPRQVFDALLEHATEQQGKVLAELLDGLHLRAALRARPVLTTAELRALHQLERVDSQHQIAEQLNVSLNTVKTQLRKLYRKLDVGSRQEALVAAKHYGLLDPDY